MAKGLKTNALNRPLIRMDDGREGWVVTKGEEQSLIYLIEEQREQIYPNYFFSPIKKPMRVRTKRKRKRVAINWQGGQ